MKYFVKCPLLILISFRCSYLFVCEKYHLYLSRSLVRRIVKKKKRLNPTDLKKVRGIKNQGAVQYTRQIQRVARGRTQSQSVALTIIVIQYEDHWLACPVELNGCQLYYL